MYLVLLKVFDSRKYSSRLTAVLFKIYQGTTMSASKNADKKASNRRAKSVTILVMFRGLLHVRSINSFQNNGGFKWKLIFKIFA